MSQSTCMQICCSPNTVSKFVRFFPKFALAFIILHIVLLILTSINKTKKTNDLEPYPGEQDRSKGGGNKNKNVILDTLLKKKGQVVEVDGPNTRVRLRKNTKTREKHRDYENHL